MVRPQSSLEQIKLLVRRFYDNNIGLLLFALGQLFSSSMNLSTRVLETMTEPRINAFQVIFCRMFITSLGCICYMVYKRIPDAVLGPKEVRGLLILRGCFGFFGLFGMYFSLNYLSLSDATVISFLSPTIAGFACSIILKEKFGKIEMYGGLISFVGVIFIAQPTASPTSGSDVSTKMRLIAIAVALLGVLGAASAFTIIRCIGQRAHPTTSVNYFAMLSTIIAFVALKVIPGLEFQLPQTLVQWLLILLIGICGFLYQFLITSGLQREKAGRASNMLYLQMFFAFLFEKIVWNETPGYLEYLGSAIILCSTIFIAVSKKRSTAQIEKVTEVRNNPRNFEIHAVPQSETYEMSELDDRRNT
ncbi:hypothetical protein V1511DRAFT_454376 [Dipodascopsis uninucleata]